MKKFIVSMPRTAKILLIFVLLLPGLTSLTRAQSTKTNIAFYSKSLKMERNVQLYLPEGYSPEGSARYPVIYFLHGADQNSTSNSELLTAYNNLIETQEILPCIIVKPDGRCPPWERSYFTNSELYGDFEDYIVYDLVAYIDSAYNTVSARDKRAVMGYSMGAYGAMKLALKHPDLFCGVAAHSGMLNMRMCSQYVPSLLSENGGAPVSEYKPDAGPWTYGAFAIAGALSPNLDNAPYFVDFPLDSMGNWIDSVWNRWSAENCPSLARGLTEEDDLAIYFDCGLQDETLAYAFNTSFADSLDHLGIPFEFQSFTGGHYNKLSTRFPVALCFLDSVMNPEQAECDTWSLKRPIPTPRGFTSGTVVDEKIYVIGGFPSHYAVTKANEMYDPATDTWTQKAGLPAGRCAHATCTYDGKIYVFGGVGSNPYASAVNDVYMYDPLTDAWTQKTDMPYNNAFCGIAVINDTIYLFGGTPQFFSPPVATVMAYDPAGDSWIPKAGMPHARAYVSACTLDGRIYVFGGGDENLRDYAFKYVEVYDPATDTWTTKTQMPTGSLGLSTCSMHGKIFVMGGVTDGLQVIAANQIYDPVTDTWSAGAPMQVLRQTFFLGPAGDQIYAIGGSYPDPQNPTEPIIPSSVEEYSPCSAITGLGEWRKEPKTQGAVSLSQNYPNPFRSTTTFQYRLPTHAHARISLYDIQGREVRVLEDGKKPAGSWEVTWDGKNIYGHQMAGGIYFCRLMINNEPAATRKLLLEK